MKVGIAFDFGAEFVEDMRASFPEVEFASALTDEEQLREVPDAEVQFGTISREAFAAGEKLKWFSFIGIGFDSVTRNVPEIVDSSVVMTLSRGVHAAVMADHALGMIVALAHRLPETLADQQKRIWDTKKYLRTIKELSGSTLGILAFGDIGRETAKRAVGFDMSVCTVDLAPRPADGVTVWGLDRLDDMLALSDWLVVTAPRTEQTLGMIGTRELQVLKEGAGVIVVSRGGIVGEEALVEGLKSGRVGGAALDATVEEPPPDDSPMWDAPNLILTPHVSAESDELCRRRGSLFKENLRRYLAGEPLEGVADKKKGY